MRYQGWLAAAFTLAWTLQPAQAQSPAQAAQAAQFDQNEMRAATRRQTEHTDQANRDAAVPDEAHSAATGAQPARAGAAAGTQAAKAEAPPSYGPVLYVNGKPVADTGRRNPSEVHDEADTGANPAAQPAAPPSQETQQQEQQQQQQRLQQQRRQAARRHPAWQAESEPVAPRPLHGEREGASPGVPIPPPLAAPQPVAPSSNVINSCQGGLCTDSSGRTYNGIGSGNAGVNSNGRLCSRTGVTVQCF